MKINGFLSRSIVVAALAFCGTFSASAVPLTGEVWINDTSNNAGACTVCANPADSTFNPGAINYDSLVTGFTIGQFVNDPSGSSFSNSGIAALSMDNTHFRITGTIGLLSGNNSFIVGHDDGVVMSITGIGTVVNQPLPTSFDSTPFNVIAPSAGNYAFVLDYNECCGAPAELLLSINDVVISSTPLPAALPLFASGLGALGMLGWRRKRKSAALAA